MKHLLLTYGTLKKSHRNSALLDNQKYLGKAITKDKFRLFEINGNYKYPAMVSEPLYQVVGELYECTDKCMDYLDKLEGVNYGLYERRPILVKTETGEEAEAIAYFFLKETFDCDDAGPCWPKHDSHFFEELYEKP